MSDTTEAAQEIFETPPLSGRLWLLIALTGAGAGLAGGLLIAMCGAILTFRRFESKSSY